ncbi:uncharacterized protein UTRI_04871_B [Ustilago trichophora]|uniref:Uncharacterized protein n=1 Tax=Ustilago trichophora TaxID=86804 RepID=A0A5C3EFL1_9BASI|nr:uncharacterized protein UTRI_04871_B [Ustilago trichophora]
MKFTPLLFLAAMLFALSGTLAAASLKRRMDPQLLSRLTDHWSKYAKYDRSRPLNVIQQGELNVPMLNVLKQRIGQIEKARWRLIQQERGRLRLGQLKELEQQFHPWYNLVPSDVTPERAFEYWNKFQEDLQKIVDIENIFDKLAPQVARSSH